MVWTYVIYIEHLNTRAIANNEALDAKLKPLGEPAKASASISQLVKYLKIGSIDDLDMILGRHHLAFGAEILDLQMNTANVSLGSNSLTKATMYLVLNTLVLLSDRWNFRIFALELAAICSALLFGQIPRQISQASSDRRVDEHSCGWGEV